LKAMIFAMLGFSSLLDVQREVHWHSNRASANHKT
jgi:hypothetical protein